MLKQRRFVVHSLANYMVYILHKQFNTVLSISNLRPDRQSLTQDKIKNKIFLIAGGNQ